MIIKVVGNHFSFDKLIHYRYQLHSVVYIFLSPKVLSFFLTDCFIRILLIQSAGSDTNICPEYLQNVSKWGGRVVTGYRLASKCSVIIKSRLFSWTLMHLISSGLQMENNCQMSFLNYLNCEIQIQLLLVKDKYNLTSLTWGRHVDINQLNSMCRLQHVWVALKCQCVICVLFCCWYFVPWYYQCEISIYNFSVFSLCNAVIIGCEIPLQIRTTL